MPEKITKKAVDALKLRAKADKKTCYIFDSEQKGFAVLATKTGVCNYIFEYRLKGAGGSPKRVTIGRHGALTPDQARTRAIGLAGDVSKNVDVSQVEKDARAKLKGATFRDVVVRYLDDNEKDTRYWREKRVRLLSDDLKALHGKPFNLIEHADVAAVVREVRKRSHASARVLFSDIRPLFAWARDEAIIKVNPILDIKGPQPLEARDRVLSDEEIKAFWQAASAEGWPFSSVFKVLLLTGQRREEVAGMRWREVDLDAGQWTIAKERCKNGKAHTVDLHPVAVAALDPLGDEAAPRLMMSHEGEADFVFSTTGRTPVSGFSKTKARLDTRMQQILGDKFQAWRTHDLRRTAASGMAALGFQPHVIERVLNHVSGAQGGLVSVYQRHEYRDERRRAIMAWGAHVMDLVNAAELPSKVVKLRA
jgi:integrase